MHSIFGRHDEVYVPTRRKEIHYFDRFYDRGIDWYQGFFPRAEEASRYKAIGEITPDYLSDSRAQRRIAQILPECRLIVSLRDPVRRAFSWYLFAKRSHNERRTFSDFVRSDENVLRAGRYAEQLKFYYDNFPRNRLHVIIYEDLVANPAPSLEGIANFLHLSHSWDEPRELLAQRINSSVVPHFPRAFYVARRLGAFLTRHDFDGIVNAAKRLGVVQMFGKNGKNEVMSETDYAYLVDYYARDIEELSILLDREFACWQH